MHRKGLVIGILILLLGVNIGSTFAGDADVKTMSPVGFDGNTLYVGGLGPGNYTTIQAAIDDANNGDTVFVFDDSSPYCEDPMIDKTISLIGENKETTIIKGKVILNNTNNVEINEFTITKKPDLYYSGIFLLSSHYNNISDNIFYKTCESAIHFFDGSEYNVVTNNLIMETLGYGIKSYESFNNIITHNTFTKNFIGCIYLEDSDNFLIAWNNFSFNLDGILLVDSSNNNIKGNIIDSNGEIGIYTVMYSDKNKIWYNHITNHTEYGVLIGDSKYRSNRNTIFFNNIFNNEVFQAVSGGFFNLFLRNYWGHPRFFPYPIIGFQKQFLTKLLQQVVILYNMNIFRIIPYIIIDWHPTQKPYDLPDV